MSFNVDQRMRHQAMAEKALRGGVLNEAVFHAAKAAEYSFLLAENSAGQVARAYLADATELLDLAETVQSRAQHDRPAPTGTNAAKTRGVDGAADDWHLTERPDDRLDGVSGLEEVKKALRDNVIWPRQYPGHYERYKVTPQAGLLMYGPPGNGKTLIARAIAGELGADLFTVNPATIKSKWLGRSEKNVKRLFDAAGKRDRAVIFIDECDAILASHQNERSNVYTQFLTEIDGIATRRDAVYSRFILAATNKPWLLGDAVLRPGRLGQHVFVGLPDPQAREAILRNCLSQVPAEPLSWESLATRLEGYSGADIAWACESAKRRAMEREIASGRQDQVTLADVERALEQASKSVTADDLARYQRWAAQHFRA
jgi:SpoVK/Ycf46/Vps4 family AAA+-type ATPase